ncbi:MAG: peptidyl-prolyl cis-trans isomerase [Bacteroidales bacterium]|nr:peptidyl-prolyl cis-trans isomerase [Bacteroidales bacterium]
MRKISNQIILIIIVVLLFACKIIDNDQEKVAIVKVYDKFLYNTDLKGLFAANVSKEDSITITKNFIDEWIKKQLLLNKAELNLTDEDIDIEQQVEDYRSSLLIFNYKQKLIKQKLDTVVTDQEMQEYYNEYSENFLLNHNIVKVLFLVVSREAPEIEKVKRWYKSNDSEDLSRLEDYCYQYATKFADFDNSWLSFNTLLSELPLDIEDQDRHLQHNKYIETEDSLYYYFVKVNEYKLKSAIQPFEYAKMKIKSIILNKRKFTLLEELENKVYNDALNHNEFVIF